MSQLPPILLLDRTADDRELVRLVLRGAFGDVAVEQVADAAALARAVSAGRFGLVITEHDLAWIRAADLLRLIRDLRPGVPVVVLTARPLAEVAAELLHLVPEAVVPKTSAGFADLASVLRRVLHAARRSGLQEGAEGRAWRLLDGLPVGVFVASPTGNLLEVNPALATLLGRSDPASCTRRPLAEIFAAVDEGDAWRAQVLAATSAVGLDTELLRADGSKRPVRIRGWTAPGGEIHGLVEARAERETAALAGGAIAATRRATAEAEEMAYVVSHDLRQPLNQVVRYLELLDEGSTKGLDAKQREVLAHARRAAHRLETLTDGVLSYAGVGSRGTLAPVALEDVLARALERLTDERDASGAEVTHDPLPTVEANAPQMEQLFQNLLANAFKFRGDAPARVHVAAVSNGELWHLSLRDQGIGIDPKDADRIFGLFQRLHTESEYAGSGIGLALCRRIVARHGGRIWVESRLGAGATFHWTLARHPAAVTAPEET